MKFIIIILVMFYAVDSYPATCAVIDQQGDLMPTTTPLENCTEYFILDSLDYDSLIAQRDLTIDINEGNELFTFGFVIPVMALVIGLPIGIIIGMVFRARRT